MWLITIYVILGTMNVSITTELEELVNMKVESGLYTSASEVVREGLRLLQERDRIREKKLESLRIEIDKGLQDLENGRFRDGREVMAEIRTGLLERKRRSG